MLVANRTNNTIIFNAFTLLILIEKVYRFLQRYEPEGKSTNSSLPAATYNLAYFSLYLNLSVPTVSINCYTTGDFTTSYGLLIFLYQFSFLPVVPIILFQLTFQQVLLILKTYPVIC